MKKTLIALALTALPVAAMADVVLYGQIKGGVGVTSGDNGADNGTITQMEDYGSRIGFKGQEDLGNGLKAIWQVEQRVSLAGSESSEGWNNRDTFIGLEGGFGKVRAGFVSDQFNENMETMDFWEYRTGAGAEARGLKNMTRHDGRHQGVRYDSPDFAGFNFNVTQQLSDSATEDRYQPSRSTNGQNTIVGLNYENAGFFGKLGYGLYKHASGVDDGQVARIEAGYDANNLFVALAYQYAKNMDGYSSLSSVNVEEANEAAVSVAYTMGAITPKLTYAHGWDQKIAGSKVKDSGYNQVIIGADYALSKRTTALVSAGWINTAQVQGSSSEDLYSVGVGVKHVF